MLCSGRVVFSGCLFWLCVYVYIIPRHTWTCVCMCVHTVIDTDMHTHTHYRKHTCMHGNTQIVTVTNMHMPVWLCMHTHMCLHCDMHTHSHPHWHAHAHTHTHTHTHTVTHRHACTHSHRHACATVRVYTHTCTHTHTQLLFQVMLEEWETKSPLTWQFSAKCSDIFCTKFQFVGCLYLLSQNVHSSSVAMIMPAA